MANGRLNSVAIRWLKRAISQHHIHEVLTDLEPQDGLSFDHLFEGKKRKLLPTPIHGIVSPKMRERIQDTFRDAYSSSGGDPLQWHVHDIRWDTGTVQVHRGVLGMGLTEWEEYIQELKDRLKEPDLTDARREKVEERLKRWLSWKPRDSEKPLTKVLAGLPKVLQRNFVKLQLSSGRGEKEKDIRKALKDYDDYRAIKRKWDEQALPIQKAFNSPGDVGMISYAVNPKLGRTFLRENAEEAEDPDAPSYDIMDFVEIKEALQDLPALKEEIQERLQDRLATTLEKYRRQKPGSFKAKGSLGGLLLHLPGARKAMWGAPFTTVGSIYGQNYRTEPNKALNALLQDHGIFPEKASSKDPLETLLKELNQDQKAMEKLLEIVEKEAPKVNKEVAEHIVDKAIPSILPKLEEWGATTSKLGKKLSEVPKNLRNGLRDLADHVKIVTKLKTKYDQVGEIEGRVLLSRSPIDVLRMSDHPQGYSNIQSCHSQGGSHFQCALDEAKGNGFIAYLVNPEDLEGRDLDADEIFYDGDRGVKGIKPYSRLRFRRFEHDDGAYELAVPESRMYGSQVPALRDTALSWARDSQRDIYDAKPRLKELTLTGGDYTDTSDGILLDQFFETPDRDGDVKTKHTKKPKKDHHLPTLPHLWEEFLQEKYGQQGGQTLIDNTNPETREKYPKVQVKTLYQNDHNFRGQLVGQFKEWSQKKEEPSGSSKEAKRMRVVAPVHKELRQDIWDGDKLRPKVRNRLIQIAAEFKKFLGIPLPVSDILFTGSLANYNYTQGSDIDLHLLVDFDKVDENEPLLREMFTAKKSLWNDEHDIRIGPAEVELYVQDINEPHTATGVFSVTKNEWIKKPHPQSPKVDTRNVWKKAVDLMDQIDHAIRTECDSDCFERLKAKIRRMRQTGLDKGGEYSVENLAFKVLRRNGYLERLSEEATKALDRELSLGGSASIVSP